MANIQITVAGLSKLQNKLDKIENMGHVLDQATDKAVKYVHSQVPPYPPPPASSTYRRTGTLGRTIGTEVRNLGTVRVGVIGTPTVYGPWVISSNSLMDGRGPQAWMHQGRWWILQEVVKKAKEAIVAIYREALKGVLNG